MAISACMYNTVLLNLQHRTILIIMICIVTIMHIISWHMNMHHVMVVAMGETSVVHRLWFHQHLSKLQMKLYLPWLRKTPLFANICWSGGLLVNRSLRQIYAKFFSLPAVASSAV